MANLFNVDKNSTKEFWLSHVLVIISTVFAVYLAAQAGLSTAIEFESIQSDRNSYYLQSSLLDEFKDNTDQVIEMCEVCLDDRYSLYLGQKGKHNLDKFIWISMQDSADTFEVPSVILTGVRRYYKSADKTIYSVTNADYGRSWNQYYSRQIPTLLKETKEIKEKLIPIMEKEIASLKNKLESNGVELTN